MQNIWAYMKIIAYRPTCTYVLVIAYKSCSERRKLLGISVDDIAY